MSIKSSIENIDEVTCRIKVTIPFQQVKDETEKALGEASKNAHMKGFRPGKAPRDLIEKTHGPRVRIDVANKLISSSLNEAIKENKLDIIGSPEIDMADYDPGKDIEYTANVALYPKPEIKGYQKLKVKVKKHEVKDEDVEKSLTNIRKSKATLKKIESRDVVNRGDVVEAFVSIEKDGKQEARPEYLTTEIGEGQVNKELEDGFVGMKVGELKKVPVLKKDEKSTEPEIFYAIELKAISERILPELDDDFVKGLELEQKTLLELKLEIRKNLEKNLEKNKESDLHAAILEEIISKNDFKVPQVMIDNEIYNLLQRSGQIKPDNTDIKIEDYRPAFNDIAGKRVKTAVAMDMIAIQEKIELSDEEIKKNIQEMADSYKVSQEEMMKYLLQAKALNGLMIEMKRSKAIESLVSRTEVEYVN